MNQIFQWPDKYFQLTQLRTLLSAQQQVSKLEAVLPNSQLHAPDGTQWSRLSG